MLLAKALKSSTYRLALISIGLFGAAVLGFFGYVYWATASYVRMRSDQAIAAERLALRAAYETGGRSGLISAIDKRLAAGRFEGGLYLLAEPSLSRIAGNLAIWPNSLKGSSGWGAISAPEGGAALRAVFETLPDGSHLLVGKNVDDLNGLANQIKAALLLTVAFTCLLAGFASVFVTRRTVGRIESINATSRAIMQSGLGERIPLRGTRDEWDQLAGNLNLMLDRIETLMGEVRQVTDNVAHDLRTPLSHMRGRLEKAAIQPRDADRDQSLIADTMSNVDAVLRLFSSITRISQIEANDRTAALPIVNLFGIATDVADLFEPAFEEKNGQLSVVGDRNVLIAGDRDLLFDALANLVDNASKHGRDRGNVVVEVTHADGCALISVRDDGPGIPPDERQNVLKRFYRLEQSRRTTGNGLGLSLVAAVARLHLARIELLDNAPGLRFELRFPAAVGPHRNCSGPT